MTRLRAKRHIPERMERCADLWFALPATNKGKHLLYFGLRVLFVCKGQTLLRRKHIALPQVGFGLGYKFPPGAFDTARLSFPKRM